MALDNTFDAIDPRLHYDHTARRCRLAHSVGTSSRSVRCRRIRFRVAVNDVEWVHSALKGFHSENDGLHRSSRIVILSSVRYDGMATNPNQSAARTRAEESVHDDLENVSALVLGNGGELGAELLRTFVAAGATVIAPRNNQPGFVEAWGVDEYYVISLAKIRLIVAGGDDRRVRGDEGPQEFGPQFPSVAENEG